MVVAPATGDAERDRVSADGVDLQGTQDRPEQANEMLAALEASGQALGVDQEHWRAVTSLPSACWDVER